VQGAKFDLPNVTASHIYFFGDQGRALQAATGLALHNVPASMNMNVPRRAIEVRFQHRFVFITLPRR